MGCGSSKAAVRDYQPPVGFFDRYTLADLLGRGSYGSVHLAHTIEANEELEGKIFEFKTSKRHGKGQATRQREDFDAERMAWALIGVHPNIVVLRESFVDESFAYLVMERCTVSLLNAWKAEPDLNEYAYARYFMQMAQALAHIHSVDVVHRDVKHDNFILGPPDGRTVKLYDFGLSAVTAGGGGLHMWRPRWSLRPTRHTDHLAMCGLLGSWSTLPSSVAGRTRDKKTLRKKCMRRFGGAQSRQDSRQ